MERPAFEEILTRAAERLHHRGPDDAGAWVDASAGIGLAHRRLSILDLSPAGHQPMASHCGRYITVFNGEIYNFAPLRQTLERLGHVFCGHSDTEIMLAAFTQWGVEAAVPQFRGMFAFAVWDRKNNELRLGRDRLGEKPLFYGYSDSGFVFGSELKALRAFPGWTGPLDETALSLYLSHNYIPAPFSIYRNIRKLLPGSVLTLSAADLNRTRLPEPRPYWSLRTAVGAGRAQPFTGTAHDAVDELESLLRSAVQEQMVADVPLGAFLSGGIDSSTVVALMQCQSNRPVKTFTIGFSEAGYNEAHHAKAVAGELKTEHTELYIAPGEAQAVIPDLPSIYDEPFADSSQIPTYLVARLARKHVTVSLSGDGGDELFGGYDRYGIAERQWMRISRIPRALRAAGAQLIKSASPEQWNRVLDPLFRATGAKQLRGRGGRRLYRLAEALGFAEFEQLYLMNITHWCGVRTISNSGEAALSLGDLVPSLDSPSQLERMMFLDALTYLPDDILVKVDRACMAVSLESRIPLLDHRVVEFAWRLPIGLKVSANGTKLPLRGVLHRHVRPALMDRPKMGFGVPVGEWLRGPMRDWAEDLLAPSRLKESGLNSEMITAIWRQHAAQQCNWEYLLWEILMLQAWMQAN